TGRQQVAGLLGWMAVVSAAAAAGAIASADAAAFYAQLRQPPWAPPAWLFAPVWTLLYILMAVAAWLVWRVGGFVNAAPALMLFLVQLAANGLWTWLYFVWRRGGWALAEIAVLWILIVATTIAFWR